MSSSGPAGLVKVAVELPEDAPSEMETLWAEPLGSELYRLDNVPFYARGIALGDVVEAVTHGNGFPLLKRVVEPSGNRTVRIFVPQEHRPGLMEELLHLCAELGFPCETLGPGKGLIALAVTPDVDLTSVLRRLDEYEAKELAYWESGNF